LGVAESHDEHVATLFDWHRLIISVVVSDSVRVAGTEIVHTPFVGVLASCLIAEKPFEEEFAELRVRVEEKGPGRENDINSVNILLEGNLRRKITIDASNTYTVGRDLLHEEKDIGSIPCPATGLRDGQFVGSHGLPNREFNNRGIVIADLGSVRLNLRVKSVGIGQGSFLPI
jgi:hypothetical protein